MLLFILGSGETAEAFDRFWVGGAGNWGDVSHWSTISGGTPGSSIPTTFDNVYFDANSGFTISSIVVNFNMAANCHSISVAGCAVPPVFAGNFVFTISGSSRWQNGMIYNVTMTNYTSNTTENIFSNGVDFKSVVIFSGTGTWNLRDSASFNSGSFPGIPSGITLMGGTLNTNNFPVSLYNLTSTGSGNMTLNLGSSRIHVVGNTPSAWIYGTSGSVLNAGTSTINIRSFASNPNLASWPGHVYNIVNFGTNGGTISGGTMFNPIFIRKCVFNADGNLNGFNSFDTLIFNPGFKYIMESGGGQTVNNYWQCVSTSCNKFITLNSTTSGASANFQLMLSNNFTLRRCIIKDISIAVTGSGLPLAYESADLGNTGGITFVLSNTPRSLYWVGGEGDYGDKAHWSASSGGTGGNCVPGPDDNVFFDVNSGFTGSSNKVTISNLGFCRDITCDGSAIPPVFNSINSATLNIYGSSIWQSGMTYNVSTVFGSSSAKTIKSNGVKFGGPTTFLGRGSWTLQDSAYFNPNSSEGINMIRGTLNTNNFNVVMGPLNSSGNLLKILNLGSSKIRIISTVANAWSFVGSVNSINAGTSTITIENGTTFSAYSNNTYNAIYFKGSAGIINGGSAGSPVKIKKCNILKNGTLNGSTTFDTLIFNAGNTYTLQINQLQQVNKYFGCNGNPCNLLYLRSSVSGSVGNLSVLAGPIFFNFADVKDINAAGGINLGFGDRSVNSGNNNNISFANTNSGPFQPLGPDANYSCNSFPLLISGVGIFPSPDTKILWNTGASTRDINVSGTGKYWVQITYSPTCIVSDSIIIGATTVSPTVMPGGSKDISKSVCQLGNRKYFLGNSSTTTSSTIGRGILMLNTNGNTINPDSVIVDYTGTITGGGGTFTNNKVGYYQSTDGNNTFRITKRLHSVIAPGTFNVGPGVTVRIYYLPADTTNMRTDAFPGSGSLSSEGWFKCSANTPQGTVANLRPDDILGAQRITPKAWGTEAGVKYVEFNVTSFSTFGYFTSSMLNPLPVNLISFNANLKNCKTELNWSTSNELNFSHFEIESSYDEKNWIRSGVVYSANNNMVNNYDFELSQNHPLTFYRLKMLDKNGQFKYSPVISLENTCVENVAENTGYMEVYPNSVNHGQVYVTVGIKNIKQHSAVLSVTDASGKLIISRNIAIESEYQQEYINTEYWLNGVYFIKLTDMNGYELAASQKLIKQ